MEGEICAVFLRADAGYLTCQPWLNMLHCMRTKRHKRREEYMQDSVTLSVPELSAAGGDISQISHILEGKFDYEDGSLDFSCTKIELVLQPGECYEGSFGVEVHGGGPTVGRIGSSDIDRKSVV